MIFRSIYYSEQDAHVSWCQPDEDVVLESPKFVLTNGSANFGQAVFHDLACLDAVVDGDWQVGGPYALLCHKSKPGFDSIKFSRLVKCRAFKNWF